MSLTPARPLSPWRWLVAPLLFCVAATVVLATPLRIAGLQAPEPIFPMVLIFAWAVIRPAVLAPVGVLAIGLFLDVFWGGALGMWAVSLLIAYGAVLSGRSMLVGQSLPMMVFWYAATTALAMGAAVVLTAMDVGSLPSPIAVGWQFLATIVLYPFAHTLIDRFEDADVRFR